MDKKSAKDLIATVVLHPLFQTLPLDACAELCQQSLVVKLVDGEVLITEDELNHSLFLIVQGVARVVMNETEVPDMQSGEIIGEISVSGISPPIASVIAKGDMEVIIFPSEAIHSLMQAHKEFAKNIKALGAERVYRLP